MTKPDIGTTLYLASDRLGVVRKAEVVAHTKTGISVLMRWRVQGFTEEQEQRLPLRWNDGTEQWWGRAPNTRVEWGQVPEARFLAFIDANRAATRWRARAKAVTTKLAALESWLEDARAGREPSAGTREAAIAALAVAAEELLATR